MALTDENSGGTGMYMPVAPIGNYYGGNNGGFGFGGDWAWILLLLLLGGNGWGVGGFGGWGGMGGMMGFGIDFPWILNGQQGVNNNVSDGFRDAQLHDSVTSVRDGISSLATQLCGCCGDMQMSLANSTAAVQQSLCNGFAGVNQGMASGFAGVNASINGAAQGISNQLYNNEIASLNRSFAEQQANQAGFTAVNAGLADAKYVEATEACATRTQAASNTRDIIDNQTRVGQAILDKLCALELASSQRETEAERRENANLRSENQYLRNEASRVAQTAVFQQGLNNEVDALYNRLKNCPVNTVPVYGNQPIFTCPQSYNSGCGCGGNSGFVN